MANENIFLQDIKSKLQYGDYVLIARVVKCSPVLVKKVLRGERGCTKGKGKQVITVAKKIIESREVLRRLGCKW